MQATTDLLQFGPTTPSRRSLKRRTRASLISRREVERVREIFKAVKRDGSTTLGASDLGSMLEILPLKTMVIENRE